MRNGATSHDSPSTGASSDDSTLLLSPLQRSWTPPEYESSSRTEHPSLVVPRHRPTSERKKVKGALCPNSAAADRKIIVSINRLNGTDAHGEEADDVCQILGPCDDTEEAHVIVHSDYHSWRPALWLKLIGLLSFDSKVAAVQKRAVSNTIRVSHFIHTAFGDKDWARTAQKQVQAPKKMRMLLVPTLQDLLSTIRLVEQALTQEEERATGAVWCPDPSTWLEGWDSKIDEFNTWRYDLLVFTPKDRYNQRQPVSVMSNQTPKHSVAISESQPLVLEPPIPTRILPLNIVLVVLNAISTMWFMDQTATYTTDFRTLLRLMEYLLVLYESPTPSAWRQHRPESLLPFNAPGKPKNGLSAAHRQFMKPADGEEACFSDAPPARMRSLRSRTAAYGEEIAFPALAAKADELVRVLADRMADKLDPISVSPLTMLRKEGSGAFGVDFDAVAQEVRAAEEEEEQREEQWREEQPEPWQRSGEDI